MNKVVGSLSALIALSASGVSAEPVPSPFANEALDFSMGFSVPVDMDGDSTNDYTLLYSNGGAVIIGEGSNEVFVVDDVEFVALPYGVLESVDGMDTRGGAGYWTDRISDGLQYFGLRFERGGQTHLGWLELILPDTSMGWLVRGGWESTPDTAIPAGAGASFVAPSSGPFAGGNFLLASAPDQNGLGNGDDITNVLVGGVGTATISAQGTNWVRFVAPPALSAGIKDVVIQSASAGTTTLTNAYTQNAPGRIFQNAPQGWSVNTGVGLQYRNMASGELLGSVYFAGGRSQQTGLFQSNTYRLDGGVWTGMAGLPTGITEMASAVYNGGFYSIGGNATLAAGSTNVYRFDGATWTEVAPLPAPRRNQGAAVLYDRLYSVGGYQTSGNSGETNVYRYDGTNWQEVTGLPARRFSLGCATLNDRLYAIGGTDNSVTRTNVYAYDGTNWTEVAGLPYPAYSASIAAMEGYIYVAGGKTNISGGVTNTARFNGTNWTLVAGLPQVIQDAGSAALDGTFYVISGYGSTNVYTYRPDNALVGVSPAGGVCTGGYEVAIYGVNLGDGSDITNVTLCGVSVASIVSQSATSVVVIAGANPVAGKGDVRVYSTSFGETVKLQYFTYSGLIVRGMNGVDIPSGADPSIGSGTLFTNVLLGRALTNRLYVYNNGTDPITITGVSTGGAGASAFQVLSLPATVAGGSQSNFVVRFSPTEIGTATCVIRIANNAWSSSQEVYFKGSAFQVSTNNGPGGGGNTLTVTNGYFGTITNVLVSGISVSPTASGDNWFTITMPAATNAGTVDFVVQTSDHGAQVLPRAYTYNAAGRIGAPLRWDEVTGMPYAMAFMGYSAYSNALYAVGGVDGTPATNVLRFDGAEWAEVAGLPGGANAARVYLSAAEYDGKLFAVGGQNDSAVVDTVFAYDGSAWLPSDSLPYTCMKSGVAALGGYLYSMGGNNEDEWTFMDFVNEYDGDAWTEWGNLPTFLAQIGVAAYQGRIHVVGGIDGDDIVYTNTYAFDGSAFVEEEGLPQPRSYLSTAVYNDQLWAIGGYDGISSQPDVYCFDGTNWSETASLPVGLRGAGAGVLNDSIYVFGGYAESAQTNVYTLLPETLGVSPSNAASSGGTVITIEGVNLGNGSDITNVTLCGVSVQSIVSQSATQIVVVAGVSSAGLGDVRVYSTSFGETVKSNAFTYFAVSSIAAEPFDYTVTRWGTNVPGYYNGGTGWGTNTWQVDLTQQPGHPVPQAAIFGTNDYAPYEPQVSYAWGHGGRLYRDLGTALDSSPGSKVYFCLDMYTPETANSHVSGTLGGFGISIESQAGKPGELITYTPVNNTWDAPKPVELTGLYGTWHRMTAEIEFFATGSVIRAWIDASQETDPHEVLASTCTTFSASRFYIAHWGDSGYALVDNIIIGTNFSEVALSLSVLGTNGALITSGEAPTAAKGTLFPTLLQNYSRTNVFAITNSGSEPITLTDWATNGTGAAQFTAVDLPDAIAPGAVSNFSVIYHPTNSGVHTASLSFSNNSALPSRVINLAGSSAQCFTSPSNGAYAGGYEVTIWYGYGSEFTNVIVGAAEGVAPTEAAADHVMFVMPTALAAGSMDIVLQRAGDTDVTLTNAFTYEAAWFIVSPSNGPYAGGNTVTVTHGLNSVITNVVVRGADVPTSGADTNGFSLVMPAVEYTGWANFTMQRAEAADFVLTNAYAYNPSGFIGYSDPDTWVDVPGLPEARYHHAAAAMSNRMYVIGGYDGENNSRDTVYAFDGTNWTADTALPFAMAALGATSDGTNIWLAGGDANALRRYDGVSWETVANMTDSRSWPLMAIFSNRPVVLSGGVDAVTEFDGVSMNELAPIPNGVDLFGGAGGVLGDFLIAAGGGLASGASTSAWRYDGSAWSDIVGLPAARYYMATAVWRDQVYALGGLNIGDSTENTVYRFDGTNWSSGAVLPYHICAGAAAVLNDALYHIGGMSDEMGALTNVYKYVPGEEHAGISPACGNLSGGYLVTIRGTNLCDGTDATNVTLCGVSAQSIVSQSATQIVVLAGASSVLTNGDVVAYSATYGVTVRSNAFSYIYLSAGNGPYAGGNTVTLTNFAAIGNGSDITNVLVGGIAAAVTGQGTDWVRFILGAATNAGASDIVVQSGSIGETVFTESYTYNFPGVIGWRDPDSAWEETVPLEYRVIRAPLVTFSNTLYVIGGRQSFSSGTVYTNVCRFDGTNWEMVAGLPVAAMNLGAAVWNGAIYATGNNTTNVYRYDGSAWAEVAGLPAARRNPLVCAFSNRLHVLCGGSYSNVFVYDGTNWSETVGLPDQHLREYVPGGVLGDYLYVSSCNTPGYTDAWRFNGTEWTAAPGMDVVRYWVGAAATMDRLYAVGGAKDAAFCSDTVYFDGTNWLTGPGLPYNQYLGGAAELNGALYAIGGARSNVLRMALGETHFGVSPVGGTSTGGYEVIIGGSNLCNGTDATNVMLCGADVQSIVSQTPTQIVVIAGAAIATGLGDVRVYSTRFGETVKNNAFTYTMPDPIVRGTNDAEVVNGAESQLANGTKFPQLRAGAVQTNTFSIENLGPDPITIEAIIRGVHSFSRAASSRAARPDPSVTVNGITYPTKSDYYASNQFKAEGRRCGTKSRARLMARYKNADIGDCSMDNTTIRGEYWPAETQTVRVVVHIIHKTDNTGNLDDDRIARQIDVLNEDYEAMAGTLGELGFNTKIHFELVGITRTANDGWFNDDDELGYKTALAWDVRRYCNIYINTASGYLGYAYYPQEDAGLYDGLVIYYDAFGGRDEGDVPYDQGRTVVHEMGHYLGLYHTFEGGDACLNTYTTGDLIVDTPAEATDHYGCTETASCTLPDPIHNYMNYTDDLCMEEFTSEQANRMVCALTAYRVELLAPETFHISPADGWQSEGATGGPFSPAGAVYAISNNASSAIQWTATGSQPWLVVAEPASGTLASGEVEQVSVSIAAEYAPTNAGTYTASVAFSNTTDGAVHSRAVTLFVTGEMAFHLAGMPAVLPDGAVSNFTVSFGASEPGDYAAELCISNSVNIFTMRLSGSVFATFPAVSGPLAGGNTITISNGYFGMITNVLIGGISLEPEDYDTDWFTVVLPPATNAGPVDIIVQTEGGDVALPNAYTYNPAGEIGGFSEDWSRWEEIDGLPAPRAGLAAGTQDGLLYAVGGRDGVSTGLTNMFVYNSTNWVETTGLPTQRYYLAVGTFGRALHAVGGWSGGPVSNVYRYNGTNWLSVEGLPSTMAYQAVGTWGDELYAVGGVSGGSLQSNAYRYNGTNWTTAAGLPSARYGLASATQGGSLYAIGGRNGSSFYQTNVYRFVGSNWVEVVGLPSARYALAAATLDDSLYVIGGQDNSGPHTNVYRFVGSNWVEVVGLPSARYELGAAVLGDSLYAIGGRNSADEYQTNVYRYPWRRTDPGVSPASGSWTGGYTVVITGTNLGDGADITNVTLSGIRAQSIESQSATQIIVTAGASISAGVGDVRVFSTSFGETVKSNAFEYMREQQAALVFEPVTPQANGTTNALSVSGGSGTGAVSYAVLSGPGAIVGSTNLVVTNGSGTVVIRAIKAEDSQYMETSVTGSVIAAKGAAGVYLADLAQTYNGTARSVSATSDPSGLTIEFTYDGHAWAPTNAGSYTVTGTVNDANWQGSSTGTLVVSKATAGVYLSDLAQTYNGTARSVSATSDPSGLTIEFTYDGHAWAPTNVGSYAVTGTVNDANWQGSSTGTLVVSKAAAVVYLADLAQTYNGTARSASATSDPSGLTIEFTYDGHAWAPTNAGSYAVTGTIADSIYQGVATGVLTVSKADQSVEFPTLGKQRVINTVGLRATASSGLPVTFSVLSGPGVISGGTNLSFTDRGEVEVEAAQVGDDNWNGTAVTQTVEVSSASVYLDFDGDGRADIAVFWPEAGMWYILQSGDNTGRFQAWGWNEAIPVPGDYDGDSLTDVAVYEPENGAWHIWLSDSQTNRVQAWGFDDAWPVPGDYDGDGLCDCAVYTPETGMWSIWQSATETARFQAWGYEEAEPVPADYDGDGLCDLAVYVPDTGTWLIWQSASQSTRVQPWGWSEAEPIPGDYDGDGLADVCVYDGAAGVWLAWLSASQTMMSEHWGWNQALAVPADYDGDGQFDRTVYAPIYGMWYLWQSGSNTSRMQPWGWNEAEPMR